MELRNPLFKNMDECYDSTESRENCATIKGTFGKTLFLIGLAIASAVLAIVFMYNLTEDNIGTFFALLVVSLIVALVAGLIATFSVRLCPVFSIIYAVSEGFMLGVISLICDLYYPGIAITAVIATFAVTLTMGILYFTGVIKVGRKFRAFIFTAFIAIIVTSLALIIMDACGFHGIHDLLYSSPLGWVIDIAIVLIAALSLCVDFDYAARLADSEAEKKYEWKAAFCLTTSIIYLYLRILQLLIRIAAASKK